MTIETVQRPTFLLSLKFVTNPLKIAALVEMQNQNTSKQLTQVKWKKLKKFIETQDRWKKKNNIFEKKVKRFEKFFTHDKLRWKQLNLFYLFNLKTTFSKSIL